MPTLVKICEVNLEIIRFKRAITFFVSPEQFHPGRARPGSVISNTAADMCHGLGTYVSYITYWGHMGHVSHTGDISAAVFEITEFVIFVDFFI